MSENEKQMQDLLLAITTLEKTQETTTKNVDKLVTHMENLLPIHTDIANLKKIVYGLTASAIVYVAWSTIEYHRIDNLQQKEIALQKEKLQESKKKHEYMLNKINHNENQITYLKGRIK